MRLLCFGDSNTYGYDPHSLLGDRYSPENRWPDRLAADTGWEVLNRGMNGRCIPAVCSLSESADLLLVMLGSNDLLQGCSPADVAARMEAFLRSALPLYRDILLISPPPMQRGAWVTEDALIRNSQQLPAEYRRTAALLGVEFADAAHWEIPLSFDGVHFTEEGHHVFAAHLAKLLLAGR